MVEQVRLVGGVDWSRMYIRHRVVVCVLIGRWGDNWRRTIRFSS